MAPTRMRTVPEARSSQALEYSGSLFGAVIHREVCSLRWRSCWMVLFGCCGNASRHRQRLNQEIGQVLAKDDVKQKFAAQNMTLPPYKSADEFTTTVKNDIAALQGLARGVSLKPD